MTEHSTFKPMAPAGQAQSQEKSTPLQQRTVRAAHAPSGAGIKRNTHERHAPARALSFSVVILSWNRVQEIRQCIETIREQFSGEIVVVDQGSTDGSLEYLQSRDDLTLISLTENLGVSGGRNVGFSNAAGDVVISIDSDAWFDASFNFDTLRNLFVDHPDVAVIAFKLLNTTTGDLDDWGHPYPASYANQPFESSRFKGGAHAVRKAVFTDVGCYDESLFFFWEEVDFAFRLLAKGHTILYSPAHLVHHDCSPVKRMRWDGGRFYYLVRNRLYVLRKYFSGWPRFSEMSFMLAGYLAMAARNRLLKDYRKAVADAFAKPLRHTLTPPETQRLLTRWKRLDKANRRLGYLVKTKIFGRL